MVAVMKGMELRIDGLEEAVRKVLREMAPAEARGMADAAAEVPGLDALACNALADWLEERGLPAVGARVRALPLKAGDVLFLQPTRVLGVDQMRAFRESCHRLHESLQAAGRNIDVIALPHGFTVQHCRTGGTPS